MNNVISLSELQRVLKSLRDVAILRNRSHQGAYDCLIHLAREQHQQHSVWCFNHAQPCANREGSAEISAMIKEMRREYTENFNESLLLQVMVNKALTEAIMEEKKPFSS